jgi:hypothetical protein
MNGSRIIIFETEDFFLKMCSTDKLYSDRTFDSVPGIFTQLYTIHGFYKGEMIPFIYALLLEPQNGVPHCGSPMGSVGIPREREGVGLKILSAGRDGTPAILADIDDCLMDFIDIPSGENNLNSSQNEIEE